MKPQPPWSIEQEYQQPKPKRSAWELQARCEPQAHHKQIRCTDHRAPRRRCSATKAGPQGTIDNLCALPPNTAPMWPSLSVTPRPEQTTRVRQVLPSHGRADTTPESVSSIVERAGPHPSLVIPQSLESTEALYILEVEFGTSETTSEKSMPSVWVTCPVEGECRVGEQTHPVPFTPSKSEDCEVTHLQHRG